MRGKRRPTAERAQAVGLATVVGIPDAAKATGIPERTVRDWFDSEEFAELRARTKEQVSEEWWAGVQKGVKAIVREFDGDAPLRDKAVAVGVLFDKLALMRGEATGRTETRSLSDAFDDHELHQLREYIHRDLAAQPAPQAAVDDPGEGQPAPADD